MYERKHSIVRIFLSVIFVLIFIFTFTAFAQEEQSIIGAGRTITAEDIKLEYDTLVYNTDYDLPGVTIDGLTEGTDYIVEDGGYYHPGVYDLIITGQGAYNGVIRVPYAIKAAAPKVVVSKDDALQQVKLQLRGNETYEIYRAVGNTSDYQLYAVTEESTYIDAETHAGETYYYKVRVLEEDSRADSDFTTVSIFVKLSTPELSGERDKVTCDHQLSWNVIKDADEYQVWRKVGSNGTYKLYKTTTKTNYTDTAITAGKQYYYKVKAVLTADASADSAYSERCKMSGKLMAPTNVKISGSGYCVKLSWDEVDGADYYQVARTKTKSVDSYRVVDCPTKNKGSDDSVQMKETYYYMVRACVKTTDGSNWEMYCSDFTPLQKCTVTIPAPRPGYYTDRDTGKLTISWGDEDRSNYKTEIWRATTKNGTYKKLSKQKSKIYVDDDAVLGKTYYYRLRYIDSSGSGLKSPYVYINATRSILPVKSLKAVNLKTKGHVKLSWSKRAAADYYIIKRNTKETGTYKEIGTTDNTVFTDQNAVPGKRYYYKVIAVYEKNKKANSYPTTCKARWTLPKPVVTLTSKTKQSIKVSWKAVDGATEYQVWRATSKNGTYKRIKTTSNCYYTNKKLTSGKKYYYKVKAVYGTNANANSAYSTVKSIEAK